MIASRQIGRRGLRPRMASVLTVRKDRRTRVSSGRRGRARAVARTACPERCSRHQLGSKHLPAARLPLEPDGSAVRADRHVSHSPQFVRAPLVGLAARVRNRCCARR